MSTDPPRPENPQDLLPDDSLLTFDDYLEMQSVIGDRDNFEVLYRLSYTGPKTFEELGRETGHRDSRLARSIERLSDAGLVRRIRGPAENGTESVVEFKAARMGVAVLEHGVLELMEQECAIVDQYSDTGNTSNHR